MVRALRRAYNLKHYTNRAVQKCIWCHQQRFITMSASRLEKEVEELKTNPYYQKYADKIASLQKTSPDEFLSRIEQRTKEQSKKPTEAVKERQVDGEHKTKNENFCLLEPFHLC